jgi:catechol 2,3-dioxygenase-like lactoylglutathione lyase family enzyme
MRMMGRAAFAPVETDSGPDGAFSLRRLAPSSSLTVQASKTGYAPARGDGLKLRELTPMLWTRDLKESVDFYTTRLGFQCGELREDWGWASLTRDGVEIMLVLPNAHEPFEKPVFTGSLDLRSDDVDAAWGELKDKVRVCYPIEDFEHGMREFAIYDNNGYLLQIGQEIPRGRAEEN